jgi:putative phosphoesterase
MTETTNPSPSQVIGPDWITLGVVADTHIPDRVNQLHPEILPTFSAANVQYILHAGDISAPRVLADLAQIAPVRAVRGNRDFLAGKLSMVETLDINGVHIALMHGHGSFSNYLLDKVHFYKDGYVLQRYLNLLMTTEKAAQVVVFGHTHYPEIAQYNGKVIFNPGSASFGYRSDQLPHIGLLHISPAGEVHPQMIALDGWKISSRQWVRKN